MSTIHANTPRDALIRLETLSLMSDVEIPVYVARAQVASAINLIVQIARFTRRRLAEDHPDHRGPGTGRQQPVPDWPTCSSRG